SRTLPFVRHLHYDEKLGRGRALSNAFAKARGRLVAYMDVDLSTPPRHLREMIAALEDCDVVTGSRYLSTSSTRRSSLRLFLSKGFNLLIQLLLGSRVSDHQCGFKGFRREVAISLCRQAVEAHWFWDTELLVLAQRQGLRVKEIPVEWREGKETKVNFKRDVLEMAAAALRMRLREWG
ncbi:MAG: glycosyltransferase, partial [Candidatus Micrarchaeota archaeon]